MTVEQALDIAIRYVSSGWSNLGPTFPVLVILMLFDVVTGLQAAFATRSLNSSTSWRGMNKKFTTVTVCALSAVIGYTFGIAMLPNAVAGAYCVVEILSISENLHRAGVWVPPILQGALLQAQHKLESTTVTVTAPSDTPTKATVTTTPVAVIVPTRPGGGDGTPPANGSIH